MQPKKHCHLTQGREECGVCKKSKRKNYVWRIIFGGSFQLCFKSWKMQLHASLADISLDSRWQMRKTLDLFSSGWAVRSFTITAQSSLTKGWFKSSHISRFLCHHSKSGSLWAYPSPSSSLASYSPLMPQWLLLLIFSQRANKSNHITRVDQWGTMVLHSEERGHFPFPLWAEKLSFFDTYFKVTVKTEGRVRHKKENEEQKRNCIKKVSIQNINTPEPWPTFIHKQQWFIIW